MRLGWGKLIVLVGVLAIIGGIVLLGMQSGMAEMRDEEGFDKAVFNLMPEDPDGFDSRKASVAFHELRRQHDTSKSDLFDTGTWLICMGLLVSLVGLGKPRLLEDFVTRTQPLISVAGVCILASGAFVASGVLSISLRYERYEYPPWADSLGIPFAGMPMVAAIVFVVVFALSAFPYLQKRRRGITLFEMPSRTGIGTVVAWALYGSSAICLILLAAMQVSTPGGWLTALSLLIGAWLMLHARAVTAA